jgi:hypothetical protein
VDCRSGRADGRAGIHNAGSRVKTIRAGARGKDNCGIHQVCAPCPVARTVVPVAVRIAALLALSPLALAP